MQKDPLLESLYTNPSDVWDYHPIKVLIDFNEINVTISAKLQEEKFSQDCLELIKNCIFINFMPYNSNDPYIVQKHISSFCHYAEKLFNTYDQIEELIVSLVKEKFKEHVPNYNLKNEDCILNIKHVKTLTFEFTIEARLMKP